MAFTPDTKPGFFTNLKQFLHIDQETSLKKKTRNLIAHDRAQEALTQAGIYIPQNATNIRFLADDRYLLYSDSLSAPFTEVHYPLSKGQVKSLMESRGVKLRK